MRLRPFIPYFGSKWRAAKHYPQPMHSLIVEPFAGGAGYALNYSQRRVLLVDKYDRIVGVWKYLIGVSDAEFMSLPLVRHVDDARGVPPEAKDLIGWWLNHATTSPRRQASTRFRSRPGSHWGERVRARLAGQLKYIRHWKAVQGTYDQCADRRATWFVDPPYQQQGRNYVHSMIDYDHLAAWCRERATASQVIVCEQAGAAWLPFRHLAHVKNACTRKDRKAVSSEMIWP